MVKEGVVAPDFSLPADDGSQVTLKELRGKKVVLYFYPKDDTPGCTTQSCAVRDARERLEGQGVAALGISPDKPEKQAAFDQKFGLGFPLLRLCETRGAAFPAVQLPLLAGSVSLRRFPLRRHHQHALSGSRPGQGLHVV